MRWFRATPRLAGRPPSANGASSFHLWWILDGDKPLREAEATLQVERAPMSGILQFWALQVGFARNGRRLGAGHTGLQWHPGAPGGAVNWGGYANQGGELPGRGGDQPRVDSENTRSWPWQPGRAYRLRVWSPEAGAWRSTITDLTDGRSVVVRDLLIDADELVEPVVWSEVFGRCDDPPTEVYWSDLGGRDGDGVRCDPYAVRVSYQSDADGGCANTESRLADGRVLQVTGLERPRSGRSGDLLRLQ